MRYIVILLLLVFDVICGPRVLL